MSQNTSRCAVAIVGAGPVGLSCAYFLRLAGVPVVVLEAGESLAVDMRASTFHPPTLDMLERGGVAASLIAEGTPVPRWQYRQHESGERIVFDLGLIADFTRHPFRLQCEQWRLTRAIATRFKADEGASLLMGATVTAVHPHDDGVEVQYQQGGAIRRVGAAFLVACDGASSAVRRLLSLPFEGDTYPSRSITVVVDCRFEDYLPNLLEVNYCWAADGHFSLMRVGAHWRTGFSPKAGQSVEEALADDHIEAHIKRVAGPDAKFRVVHKGAYTVHRRLLEAFRHGRVLFAGDAAHLNSPSGGMGMNSGIHDAYVLAGALSAVLGGAPESRLEEYARQRREVAAEEVQQASDRHHRMHREKDPVRRQENWQRLKAIANEPGEATDYLLKSSMLHSLMRHGVAPIPSEP